MLAQQKLSTIQAPPAPVEKLVSLQTGGCKGYCPIYRLTFYKDGNMEFNGYRAVEKVGNEMVKITADEYTQLLNAVRRANLWEHPARIPSDIVDAPMHTLTAYDGEKKHAVKGMGPLPEHLAALDQLMQDIAEAHGIRVKKGVDLTDPANMTGQVVVKFQPEVNAGNFCMQFMELTVKPVRRLAEENLWLIGFYPAEISEDNFISIMQGMEGVVDAKPASPRKED